MVDTANLSGLRVLVTGGAGFIGSHLCDRLLEQGAVVRVLDDFSSGRESNLRDISGHIEVIRDDIRDIAACREAVKGTGLVFHQAARGSVPRSMIDPAGTFDVNVLGTVNVFTACREAGVRRVVYASSSSVYGDSSALPKEEGGEGRPLSPYALSKRMNEELADVYARCFGMEMIGLRYFNVFGPRQDPDGPYAAVIPRLFAANLAGKPATIYGRGDQTRDFTYVSDVVEANLLAAAAPFSSTGTVMNIAGGEPVPVLDVAKRIQKETGCEADAVFAPERPGDIRHSLASTARAKELIGFVRSVSFELGLARTAEWYRARCRAGMEPDSQPSARGAEVSWP